MSTPKLRFKEFCNGSMDLFTIKDIANIKIGRDLKENSFSEIKTDKYQYPVYSNTVENRGLYGFYDFEEYDGNNLTVVGRGAGLGTAFSRCSGFGAIGRLLVVSPKNNEFNVHYFSEYVNFKLRIHNESGGIPQLPGSTFGNYEIVLPSLPEQTKIANFLTAVDDKITLLTKKADLLSQYKKGVMQQIFSQELRFKDDDGQEFEDWEEKTLGEVLDYEQPTKYLVSSTEYSNNFKIPVLTAGKTFILGYTNETIGICDKGLPVIIFDDFTTAFKFVSFPFKAKSSAMKILRKKDGFNINYIHSAMQQIDFQSGDEHKRYWISEFSRISIPFPAIKEQTKIANLLTAIDEKITNNQTQLDAVKQYKQGLLQQMFV